MNPSNRNPSTKTGRPRALNRSARSIVGLLTALGYNQKTVAHLVGCAPCTVRREVLRNPEFHQELVEARHGAEVNSLHAIIQAARTRPDAARWLQQQIQLCLEQMGLEQMGRESTARGSTMGHESPAPSTGFSSAQNWPDFCALPKGLFSGKFERPIELERAKLENDFSARGDTLSADHRRRGANAERANSRVDRAHRTKKLAKIGRLSSSTNSHRSTKIKSGRNA